MNLAFRASLAVLLTLLAVVAVQADGAWKTTNIGGIHYAIARNSLHPDRWHQELHNTYDCLKPCTVEFDDRMSAVHLRYKWMQLNPEKGVYDFSDLGQVLDEIHAAGKMATLVIMAGKYTPAWVFDDGARHIKTRLRKTSDFSQKWQPRPWDPVFQAAYQDMIKALATFLREKPERYNTLALIKNGSITVHSAETRLMPWKAYRTKLDVSKRKERDQFLFELCSDWAQAGYSENKILKAAKRSNRYISEAFPDMYMGLAFVEGSKRFPTVDDAGNCTFPEKNDTLNKIIEDFVKQYGARAVVINTVLAEGGDGQAEILNWVKANGGKIAFQIKAQEIGCRDVDAPCSEQAFENAVAEGAAAGAVFIEIHDGNVYRFRDILPAMNTDMVSRQK